MFQYICRTNFFKFWRETKNYRHQNSAAVDSNKIWKAAGKLKQRPIFAKRQASTTSYRKVIRDKEKVNTTAYTNELHDSLMGKDGPSFWKCWHVLFASRSTTMSTWPLGAQQTLSRHGTYSYSEMIS